MKKYVLLTAVLSFVATQGVAQVATVDSEVEAELDQMYGTQQTPQGQTAQGTYGGQPIIIMNQAPAAKTAPQVQKQPVTYIEASPLTKSRAEQMREARQQVEAETETKIVEKLEQSRIEDEKKRANVLFGDKLDNMQQPQQQVQPVAPTPVVAPVAPVAPVEPQESTRDIIREELQMAMTAEKEAKPEPTNQKYFSAIAGIGNYPDVSNVRGNYLLGFSYGNKYNNLYSVEGTFAVSNYSVDKVDGGCQFTYDGYYYYCPVVDVTQYSGSIAMKYYLMDSMVRPIVGGLAQFSYRTFAADDLGYSAGQATSHAIDMGIVTGADIEVSPTMTIGMDFRYMFNLSSRVTTTQRNQFMQYSGYGTPIEKLQYYTLSFAAKVNF